MSDNSQYGDVLVRKAKIIGCAFLVGITVICLFVWHLDGSAPIKCGNGETMLFLKRVTDCAGLSNLGDFLAGVFAPLAFIGLAAAFLMQKEQLRLAIEDSKQNQEARTKEAALNLQSVQTNYKLALYGERKKVFDKLVQVGDQFKGKATPEIVHDLKSALYDAQFIFPEDIYDWIESLALTADRLQFNGPGVDAMIPAVSNGQTDAAKTEILLRGLEDNQESMTFIHAQLLSVPLYKRFKPYLTLPNNIDHKTNGR